MFLCFNYISIYSSIAVYKALYKGFGGFAADVVAAIDQVHAFCSISANYILPNSWVCIGVSNQ